MNNHKGHAVLIDSKWVERVKTRKGDYRCAKCGGRFRPTRDRARKNEGHP